MILRLKAEKIKMRKSYIFIYNDEVGTREEVKNIIDSMKKIAIWRFDIPHSFYVISDYTAKELYDEFVQKNGTKGRFMFMETNANRQGQMLSDTWYLLTNKTLKPKR